jgi:hypothetical protein
VDPRWPDRDGVPPWEYEGERTKLLKLYDKGKKQQWDAAARIDWSIDLDPRIRSSSTIA